MDPSQQASHATGRCTGGAHHRQRRPAGSLHCAWPIGQASESLHRDIKPANILLSSSGQIKLLDFGIARAHFDQEHSTRSAQMGTARYMSPEQWLQGEVSSASDIYALGISVIELLLGRFLGRFPLDRLSFEMAKANAIEALDSPELLAAAG